MGLVVLCHGPSATASRNAAPLEASWEGGLGRTGAVMLRVGARHDARQIAAAKTASSRLTVSHLVDQNAMKVVMSAPASGCDEAKWDDCRGQPHAFMRTQPQHCSHATMNGSGVACALPSRA